MENLVLEECMMLVLNTFNRWLMHKISVFIKTKWYNQNLVTREKYLDKVKFVLFLFEPKLVNNLSIISVLSWWCCTSRSITSQSTSITTSSSTQILQIQGRYRRS